MSTDIGERKDPPCDCAEQIEGRWVSRCYCSNRDDGERTAAWCVEANTAAEIAKLRAEVERLTAIIAAADRGTPIYKAIERTLDEKSAWIARPSDDVTQAVALTAGIAWSIHYPLELVEQNLSLQLDNHRLRAEVERLTALGKKWMQTMSGQRREIERLTAALEPFAALAEYYDPEEEGGENDQIVWYEAGKPTIGDLRRARATITGATENKP